MVSEVASEQLRWIVALPMIAALVHGIMIGVVRRPTPPWLIVALSFGAVALAFVLSAYQFGELIALPEGRNVLIDDVYTWIGAGLGTENLNVEFALAFDALSALLCLLVTGVGALVHAYAVGYMEGDDRDDRGFQRFFCYLNLLLAAMLVLVLADGPLLMLLGWQGVAVCSTLLIGFWYMDETNAARGGEAFVANRVGDVGFLVAFMALFAALADAGLPGTSFRDITTDFPGIVDATLALPWLGEWRAVDVVALGFLVGAMGKSAQLPLSFWLSGSAVAPPPASALIHATTIVAAGVYMLCRMAFLYEASPEISVWMAWIGALTAVFGASAAAVQDDMETVLAWSTVSQAGLMFLAAGCGGYTAALFHLTTHAFFAALLFLGAGAVRVALHGERSIAKMGGLRRRLPATHVAFLIGALALAGLPPFSGFFSRDAILLTVHVADVPGQSWLLALALLSGALTAFAAWRLHCRVFYGRSRVAPALAGRIEEPAGWMMNPLYLLAVLAAFVGWAGLAQVWGDALGVPGESNSFANFLRPVLDAPPAAELASETQVEIALQAFLAALVGIALAHVATLRFAAASERIGTWLERPRAIVAQGFGLAAIVRALLVRPLSLLSGRVLNDVVEKRLVEGLLVSGTARGVRALAGSGLKHMQSGFAQTYAFWLVIGAICIVTALVI